MHEQKTILPAAPQAEASLIATLLFCDREAAGDIFDALEPDDFYVTGNRATYLAARNIYQTGAQIDIALMTEEMTKAGWNGGDAPVVFLSRIMETQPVATNIEHYARRVREAAIRRRLMGICNQIHGQCQQPTSETVGLLEKAQSGIMGLSMEICRSDYCRMNDLLHGALDRYDALANNTKPTTGVPSGYGAIDYLTSGFQRSDSIYIAGRPSMGKTALMVSLIRNQLLQGYSVGVFSLEMSNDQIIDRVLSSLTEVNLMRFRSGRFEPGDMDRITRAASQLSNERMSVDDTGGISVDEIARKAKLMKARDGIDILYIDYLGLIQLPRYAKSVVEGLSTITRRLKLLAKELNIPVVCLCQLNRKLEERTNKRPILSDLRDSGSIEQDADVVAFIYRDEVYNPESQRTGIAEIIVAKQRNGPTRTVELAWISSNARFENLAK